MILQTFIIFLQVYRHIRNGCKDSIGLPLAVQIVGRRYNEELVLRLMKELESVAEFKPKRSTL